MKQRFLNQKLGKRMSRKAELQKAKTALAKVRQAPRGVPSETSRRTRPDSSGSVSPDRSR